MIYETLAFIASRLNDHFYTVFHSNQETCIVSNLVNPDGSVPIGNSDKIVLCLFNIEQETSIANLGFTNKGDTTFTVRSQPLHLNLYITFAAYFSNYSESLKFISSTISFFQSNYVYLRSNYPQLDDTIDKLIFELVKTNYQESYYLWDTLGTKYVPSMVYKVRMLTIDNKQIQTETPLVTKTNSSVQKK